MSLNEEEQLELARSVIGGSGKDPLIAGSMLKKGSHFNAMGLHICHVYYLRW